jgi:hypothetical protein
MCCPRRNLFETLSPSFRESRPRQLRTSGSRVIFNPCRSKMVGRFTRSSNPWEKLASGGPLIERLGSCDDLRSFPYTHFELLGRIGQPRTPKMENQEAPRVAEFAACLDIHHVWFLNLIDDIQGSREFTTVVHKVRGPNPVHVHVCRLRVR